MKFEKEMEQFHRLKVLVLGDVMLDVYEYCFTAKSKFLNSEKPGKRAYQAKEPIKVLGGAGNVAVNLASLGVQTNFISVTGNDENYFKIRELSEKAGINHSFIRDPSRPTTTKVRIYLDDDYLLRRDYEERKVIDRTISATAIEEFLHQVSEADAVILSDYDKGFFSSHISSEIGKECRIRNIPLIVDFKPKNRSLFVGATVLCPNENEAKELLPTFSAENLKNDLAILHQILLSKSVVVTLGENGICGFDGSEYFHIKGHRVHANDAVGCGDTVRACLALGISTGLSLKDSAELANDAAAVVVQKDGTACLSIDELKKFILEAS